MTGMKADVFAEYETTVLRGLADDKSSTGTPLPYFDAEIDVSEYLHEILSLHFHPEHGTPYWLDRVDDLGFDPVEDITSPEDLDMFPPAEEDVLREENIHYFHPKAVPDGLIEGSFSSGTNGVVKTLPFISTWYDDEGEWWAWNLHQRVDEIEGDWLAPGPYGMIEKSFESAAKHLDTVAHCVAFNQVGLKQQISHAMEFRSGPIGFLKSLPHLKDVVAAKSFRDRRLRTSNDILRSEEISVLTTEIVPEATYEAMQEFGKSDPEDMQIVILGARHFSKDELNRVREMFPNAAIVRIFGTSFNGVSFEHVDTDRLVYYPRAPMTYLDVVGEDNTHVDVGETGDLTIHRIDEAFFWPMQVERDTARKEPPRDPFEWGGVSGITTDF